MCGLLHLYVLAGRLLAHCCHDLLRIAGLPRTKSGPGSFAPSASRKGSGADAGAATGLRRGTAPVAVLAAGREKVLGIASSGGERRGGGSAGTTSSGGSSASSSLKASVLAASRERAGSMLSKKPVA